jgi:hypothetical protein
MAEEGAGVVRRMAGSRRIFWTIDGLARKLSDANTDAATGHRCACPVNRHVPSTPRRRPSTTAKTNLDKKKRAMRPSRMLDRQRFAICEVISRFRVANSRSFGSVLHGTAQDDRWLLRR